MSPFARIETLFHAALPLPENERLEYLRVHAGDEPEVVAEVVKLLAAQSAAGARIEAAQASAALATGPSQIGSYRILRLLGRGGMGAVYLAERADGEYRQQVALKVLAPHLAGESFAARFRTERQLLAQMNHPNIVRLLDGGVSATGEPYLVTEFIDGEPIDAHCDRLKLGVRERVRLFLDVCAAVVHAHRNLVIHRDLKPANVLVDTSGTVKLLDFGTAKLVSSDDEHAAATMPLLTPRYASPEQLRNDPLSIASDVYSLGLMLYELLAGHRAFSIGPDLVDELTRASEDVAIRDLGSASTAEDAALRGLTLDALESALAGDLAAIAAKAVSYAPSGRYASAEQLRLDLLAYLEYRPIHARPVTITYKARKFLYRRRYAVAAVTAVLFASAAGVVSTIRQRQIAEERFEQVRSLARFQLFELYDHAERIPGTLQLRSEMAAQSLAYLDRLAARENLDPMLAVELAQGYRRLGDTAGNFAKATLGKPGEAARLYQKGLALIQPFAAGSKPAAKAMLELQTSLAIAEVISTSATGSLAKLEQSIAALERATASDPRDLDGRLLLGRAYTAVFTAPETRSKTSDTTAQIARRADEILLSGASQAGPLKDDFLLALLDLYRYRAAFLTNGQPEESRKWIRRGLDAFQELDPDARNSAAAQKVRASLLMTQASNLRSESNAVQALATLDEPLAIIRNLARDPRDLQACANLAIMLDNRALMRWDAGDFNGYLADLTEQEPLTARLVQAGAGNRFLLDHLSVLRKLAYAHDKLNTPQAPAAYRRAYEALKKAAAEDSLGFRPKADLADLLLNLSYEGRTRPDEALAYAEQAARMEPDAMNAWESVAEANRQLKRYDKALEAISRAIRLMGAPADGASPTVIQQDLLRKQREIIREAAGGN